MIASTRRHSRTRTSIAVFAALSLGLAACGGDDDTTDGTDDTEVEAPADDGEVTEEPADPDLDADAGDAADDGEDLTAPGFEDLEDGELVPGVYLDIPEPEQVQAQPTPTGSGYIATLPGQQGAISLNVEFEGQPIDDLLAGVDDLVAAGQAEVASGPDEVEVEGADEAYRVELAAPEGGAVATGIFATAGGNAISLAVETAEDADVDVEALIESLRIDVERLQLAGTLEMDPPAGDGTDADAGVDPADDAGADDAGDAGADDAGDAGAGDDAGDDAATEPDDG